MAETTKIDDNVLLSDQTFFDSGIFDEKIKQECRLYAVLSQKIIVDNTAYRIIIDGHHSIRAHQITKKELVVEEKYLEMDSDTLKHLIKERQYRVFMVL